MLNLRLLFDAHIEAEFLKFERIANPLNPRPDVCAFLLLDRIVQPVTNYRGGKSGMVAAAEHDEIFLDVDIEQLSKLATEEQIVDLIRCGIRYDSGIESLAMYV